MEHGAFRLFLVVARWAGEAHQYCPNVLSVLLRQQAPIHYELPKKLLLLAALLAPMGRGRPRVMQSQRDSVISAGSKGAWDNFRIVSRQVVCQPGKITYK